MMNAKPYELILLSLDENADVEAVKAQIKENATPIKEAFMNLAQSK